MKRVVLDSNVLVSALSMPYGVVGQILDAWQERRFILVISDYIINEVGRILEFKMRLDRDFIVHKLGALYNLGEMVEPMYVTAEGIDDNDLPILGTAVAGFADVLVTGDSVLCDLQHFQGVLIIRPREFLDAL